MVSRVLSAGVTLLKWGVCAVAPLSLESFLRKLCYTKQVMTNLDEKNPWSYRMITLFAPSAVLLRLVNHTSWKAAFAASAVFHLCIGFVRKETRGSWKVSPQMDVARNSQQSRVYAELEEDEQLSLRIEFIRWISQWLKNKTITLPFKGFEWESMQLQINDERLIFTGYNDFSSQSLWSIQLLNNGSIPLKEELPPDVERLVGLIIGQFMMINACFSRQSQMNPQIYANRMGDVFDEWCNNIFSNDTLLREPVVLFNRAIGGPSNFVVQQFEEGSNGHQVTFALKVRRDKDQTETLWECIVQKTRHPNSWILQSNWILHKADENWYIRQRSNGDGFPLSQTFTDEKNQEGSYVAAIAQLLLDPHTVVTIKNTENYRVNGTLIPRQQPPLRN